MGICHVLALGMRYDRAMHPRTLLIAGSCTVLLLSGCWWDGSSDSDGSQSSSSSSVASVASARANPGSSYTGEFKRQADGSYLGSVTLTGYVTKREVREPFCERNCQTYQYVFFRITDGVTPDLETFLRNNAGNSYADQGVIGLGCVSDDGRTIHSEVADPDTYMSPRDINAADTAILLKSNVRNLVTVTLNRDYEPAGGEAPACYSHFEYVTVTN